MKKLLAILSVILFANQASAEDIKMQCDMGSGYFSMKTHFKYSDKIFKDKAYIRVDGQWVDFCDGMEDMLQSVVDISQLGDNFARDKSAACHVEINFEAISTLLIDFELMIAKFGFSKKNLSTGEWSDFRWDSEIKCTSF